MDGIYLRRNWGGEFENVAILVAITVNEDGYREVLGAAEGMNCLLYTSSFWLSAAIAGPVSVPAAITAASSRANVRLMG